MPTPLDVERCRSAFPALSRTLGDAPVAYLDGPAGSQVPRGVIDAVTRCLESTNANSGGVFETSAEVDALLDDAHAAVADLLGSPERDLVVFGPNMTTLTLALARAVTRVLEPGDEIVVTQLEHDANYTPWVQAATDAGALVREVRIRSEDCTLDVDDLRAKLSSRTRLVAVGAASNAVGTINPVAEIVRLAHEVGARVFVDAVHYAPHASIDVEAWGCDLLACSAYKFFGPHVGILWGRRELLAELPVYKLRPVSEELPQRWMTGTQNHEGIAGTLAAIDYLAEIGRRHGAPAAGRREALLAGYDAIRTYELALAGRLLERLDAIPALHVFGITDPARGRERVPTVSLTHARRSPVEVARHLARRGLFVWHGNYYALPLTRALGVEPQGMVRVGLLHYNTVEEIERLARALEELEAR